MYQIELVYCVAEKTPKAALGTPAVTPLLIYIGANIQRLSAKPGRMKLSRVLSDSLLAPLLILPFSVIQPLPPFWPLHLPF